MPNKKLQAAASNGFAVLSGKGTISNAHYRACKESNSPFIQIRPGRVYSSVMIDMWPCLVDLSGAGTLAVMNLFARFSEAPADFHVHQSKCICERVPRDRAEQLARELWQLAGVKKNVVARPV